MEHGRQKIDFCRISSTCGSEIESGDACIEVWPAVQLEGRHGAIMGGRRLTFAASNPLLVVESRIAMHVLK